MTRLEPATFEALYRADPDPWSFATSPYEAAKYERTLAALGDRHFARTLELGCSIGVLSAGLAARSEELVAIDAAPTAVAAARQRLAGIAHVDVREATIPEQLPRARWDLVVASEVLYYFTAPLLDESLDVIEADLRPGGVLLAVHWTPPTETYPLSGDAVHELLLSRPALTHDHGERHERYRLDRFVRRGPAA